MQKVRAALAFAAVTIGFFVLAGPASATTWCVPGFSAACPNSGGNQVPSGADPAAKLESAMNAGATQSDGTPDTILVAAGTVTDPDTITASAGTDDLLIQGAGRELTTLTSSNTANSYLINLNSVNRKITFKDLEILVPSSFPNDNGPGSAVQSNGDNFESVNLVTENVAGIAPNDYSSSGFDSIINGGTFRDVKVFGRNGATFGRAFNTLSCGAGGATVIENVSITSSREGVTSKCPTAPVTIDRAHISGVAFPIQVISGADLTASNLLIESGSLPPIDIYANTNLGLTDVKIDHATIVATGDPAQPAIRATVPNVATAVDSVKINLSNSIVAGFGNSWNLSAPVSPARGNIDLIARYSNFEPTGVGTGDVTIDASTANISGNPGFAGITDFHLAASSSAIDAGDPSAALPSFDLEGNNRPADGNGDGTPVRDMGAFESPTLVIDPPPQDCTTDPSLCPVDRTAPEVSELRFRARAKGPRIVTCRVSENARLRLVFRPVLKKAANGKKRKPVMIVRKVKQGKSRLAIARSKLKPGRYRLIVTATDTSGNISKSLRKNIKVKP